MVIVIALVAGALLSWGLGRPVATAFFVWTLWGALAASILRLVFRRR